MGIELFEGVRFPADVTERQRAYLFKLIGEARWLLLDLDESGGPLAARRPGAPYQHVVNYVMALVRMLGLEDFPQRTEVGEFYGYLLNGLSPDEAYRSVLKTSRLWAEADAPLWVHLTTPAHKPGSLFGCLACESRCHCGGGTADWLCLVCGGTSGA